MKKVLFTFILGLLISVTNIQAQWTQIGTDINGEADGDYSGWSVSLNSDGSVVAIGAKNNDGNGSTSGQVRVYKNNNGTWTQVGQDIDGEAAGDKSGYSVSLNSDGSIVAIGAHLNNGNGSNSGQVRVYKNNNGTWTQVGQDIDGEAPSDEFGCSVSLNSDGSIVAIGAHLNDENGSNSGQIRVYKNNNGTWTQIGQNINGEAAYNEAGSSVSINSDGSVIAISAPYNNDNGSNSGQVRVYKNNNGTWTQVGQDINGEAGGYLGKSVSLSSDGSIVAISTPYNNENGSNSGQVRVYKNNNGTWTQIGEDINGEAGYYLGWSVSLSSDGTIVAAGAPFYTSATGKVSVYKNIDGTWTQIGEDIIGESESERSGYSVSISSNGAIVAIGAPFYGGFGHTYGQVRVYKNDSVNNISELKEAGISIYPNPSIGIFNIKNAKDYDITITDITGKVIYRTTAAANEQVHLQQSGVYIVNFKSQTKNFSSKIIVK